MAELYSIPGDEKTDVSHKDEVVFVVRYFHHIQLKERIIEVVNVTTPAGKELDKNAFLLLQKNGLELKSMYGQGYDGTTHVSGHYKNLQARLRAHNEKALNVHCICLNHALVEILKLHSSNFRRTCMLFALAPLSTMLPWWNVFLSNNNRKRALELQQDIHWACRDKALKAFQRNLNAIWNLLDEEQERST